MCGAAGHTGDTLLQNIYEKHYIFEGSCNTVYVASLIETGLEYQVSERSYTCVVHVISYNTHIDYHLAFHKSDVDCVLICKCTLRFAESFVIMSRLSSKASTSFLKKLN
jgi:hypothetical protein